MVSCYGFLFNLIKLDIKGILRDLMLVVFHDICTLDTSNFISYFSIAMVYVIHHLYTLMCHPYYSSTAHNSSAKTVLVQQYEYMDAKSFNLN